MGSTDFQGFQAQLAAGQPGAIAHHGCARSASTGDRDVHAHASQTLLATLVSEVEQQTWADEQPDPMRRKTDTETATTTRRDHELFNSPAQHKVPQLT